MNKQRLTWKYETARMIPSTATFEEQYAQIGPRVYKLIDAAKLLSVDARPATIQKRMLAIRQISEAIRRFAKSSTDVDDWALAFVRHLRSLPLKDRTRRTSFSMGYQLLQQVAGQQGIKLNVRNPFPLGRDKLPSAPADLHRKVITLARQDALAIYGAFIDHDAQGCGALVSEAAKFAKRNGGLLPTAHTYDHTRLGTFAAFCRRVHRATAELPDGPWGTRDISRHLYATMESLAPFLILIINQLAANVDAIASLERTCMRKTTNEFLGERFIISAFKPRAGRTLEYVCRDTGPLSVPWLINAVLQMSRPLLKHISAEHRKYLFIAETSDKNVRPLPSILPNVAFKSFLRRHKITGTIAQVMFRPTRIRNDFKDRKNLFRARALAQHKRLRHTADYLDHNDTQEIKDEIIAKTQSTIQSNIQAARAGKQRTSLEPPRRPERVNLPSHICLDARGGPEHLKAADGICSQAIWPLNDRHFVMPFDKRSVALLLRDYDALCEAQMRIPIERFSAVHLSRLKLIQERYLPMVPTDLLREAREMIRFLPPALRVD